MLAKAVPGFHAAAVVLYLGLGVRPEAVAELCAAAEQRCGDVGLQIGIWDAAFHLRHEVPVEIEIAIHVNEQPFFQKHAPKARLIGAHEFRLEVIVVTALEQVFVFVNSSGLRETIGVHVGVHRRLELVNGAFQKDVFENTLRHYPQTTNALHASAVDIGIAFEDTGETVAILVREADIMVGGKAVHGCEAGVPHQIKIAAFVRPQGGAQAQFFMEKRAGYLRESPCFIEIQVFVRFFRVDEIIAVRHNDIIPAIGAYLPVGFCEAKEFAEAHSALGMGEVRLYPKGSAFVPIVDVAERVEQGIEGIGAGHGAACIGGEASGSMRIGEAGPVGGGIVEGGGVVGIPIGVGLEMAVHVLGHGAEVVRLARVLAGQIRPRLHNGAFELHHLLREAVSFSRKRFER